MERRPHLELVLRQTGRARLSGGGKSSPRTEENERDAHSHAGRLRGESSVAVSDWLERQRQRALASRPPLPSGMPLLLSIDAGVDIDFVRTAFGFEILCEQEDGFLLVATEDVNLAKFEQVLSKFEAHERGGGSAAKLYEILTENHRIARVLSPELLAIWPSLTENKTYIVNLSIECLGTSELPETPERNDGESEDGWQRREERHRQKCQEIFRQWDTLREERVGKLAGLVEFYDGEVLQDTDQAGLGHTLPDSISVRIQVNGDGLRDIIQNFPFVFEACFPDDVAQPANADGNSRDTAQVKLVEPSADAPSVCVIDSGIQQGHVLLQPAIDVGASACFLPGESDVADHVSPDGHGTRVAGAVLFPSGIPRGTYQMPCWIQNARVLNSDNKLPDSLYPPSLLHSVVAKYTERGTRIFVHAINSSTAARTIYMSAWAAELDMLCSQHDVLIVQAAGNLSTESNQPRAPGVLEHLSKGRIYPDYLSEASSRIANPGQSFHAVTVGSVASASLENGNWRTIAGADQVSAFSRCGPGMWGAVKPDIVEYGGDLGVSEGAQPRVGMPPALAEAYPELVRSTMHGPGPAYDRDSCGTSFAAPKAAHIAARIAAELPQESALTYRALLVNSARWPEWTNGLESDQKCLVLQRLGHGIPDIDRAAYSTPQRVTLFVSGLPRVKPREVHVYQVRVPGSLRKIAQSYRVLVEVTMAYTAKPRRTRRTHRSYLSTWVDWKTSKKGELAQTFLSRVIRDIDRDGSDTASVFNWVLGDRSDAGQIQRTRRNLSSVQKDWAFVSGDEMPTDFCIAVVGHPGWDKQLDASAPYGLCVTFEVTGGDIDLHADVEIALEELRVELGSLRIHVHQDSGA